MKEEEKQILSVRVDPEAKELVLLVARRRYSGQDGMGLLSKKRPALPENWERDYLNDLG